MSLSNVLPQYRCHKVVRAAKIQNITAPPRGKTGAIIDLGALLDRGLSFPSMHVSSDWLAKHDPKVGGYYVVYEDGYTSYSPAEAFEAGYTRIEP